MPSSILYHTTSANTSIALTPYGSGHYDGVSISVVIQRVLQVQLWEKWALHCQVLHTNSIKCLNYNKACHSSCYCKSCSNPLGRQFSGAAPPRKRQKHEWQNYPTMNSYQFGVYKGEDVSSGPLTMLEFLSLKTFLCIVKKKG